MLPMKKLITIFILGCQSSPDVHRIDFHELEPYSEVPMALASNKNCIVLDRLLDKSSQEEDRLSAFMDWNYSLRQHRSNKTLRNQHQLTLNLIEKQNVLCPGFSPSR
jgi:hypothetical protein